MYSKLGKDLVAVGLQCERCEVKNGDKEPRGAMISARRRMYARAAVIGRWLLEPIACSCSRTTVAGGKKLSSPSCSSLLRCSVDVCFVSASMQRLDPGVVYSGRTHDNKGGCRFRSVIFGGKCPDMKGAKMSGFRKRPMKSLKKMPQEHMWCFFCASSSKTI